MNIPRPTAVTLAALLALCAGCTGMPEKAGPAFPSEEPASAWFAVPDNGTVVTTLRAHASFADPDTQVQHPAHLIANFNGEDLDARSADGCGRGAAAC